MQRKQQRKSRPKSWPSFNFIAGTHAANVERENGPAKLARSQPREATMRRKAAWIAILLLGGCAPESGLDNGAPALGLTVTRADASGISAIFTDGKVTLELKAIVSNGLVQTIIRDGAGTDLTV